jgi:hypothetical protein
LGARRGTRVAEHDVRVQDRDERAKIALAERGEERVAGLLAMILGSVLGTSFTSTGDAADSMGMSVMTGIALLCYAGILYLLRPRRTE